MSTDRNLLVGLVALQTGFVSLDQLLEAVNAWLPRSQTPLADLLRERQFLSDAELGLLSGLVDRQIERHGPAAKEVALSCLAPAVRQDLQAWTDTAEPSPATAEQSVWPETVAPDEFATRMPVAAPGSPTPSVSSWQRYRPLRVHARGGLGEVHVAVDEELKREVALKQIQDRFADDVDSRSRFVREAEITGSLEHPGIVPVYGLCIYPDGRPLYAMRFIQGVTLSEAITRFHEADEHPDRDPGERSLALRGLLTRFVAVCNAVAFAHSRRVIHRDLKPANVMLGEYGETLVVDWGLARMLDKDDALAASRLHVPVSGELLPTQQGEVLGTPAFMPPEQARGEHDRVGPHSDTWALGATLYALLTGQPPHQGADVLTQAARGSFLSPRQVKPAVPPALDAVCLRAMAAVPKERYATARDLAEEVEHWLADEPVAAYREPWRARMGRWARRHRTSVTSAVAAVGVALVSLVVATVLLGAANERERTARQGAQSNEVEAKRQRDKAREHYKLAREAVDKFHTQVSESPEMKAKGVEKLRAKLLESAAEFYRKFVQEDEGDDLEVQAERGRSSIRLGKLYTDMGRNQEARQALLHGEEICRKLSEAHPEMSDSRADLADGLIAVGMLENWDGKFAPSERYLTEALDHCRQLAETHPDEPRYRRIQARGCRRLGQLYRDMRRLDLAEKVIQQGLVINEQLAQLRPETPEDVRDLSAMLGTLAVIYRNTGRAELFETTQNRALAIHQALVKDHPEVPVYREDLAYAHDNLGNLYRSRQQNDLAEQSLLQALAVRRKLSEDHPAVVNYQRQFASSHLNLASFYRNTSKTQPAEQSCQQAIAIYKKLTDAYPELVWETNDLGLSYEELAMLHRQTGRHDLASQFRQQAFTVFNKLADAHPGVLQFHQNAARVLFQSATYFRAEGRLSEALPGFQDVLARCQRLAEANPNSSEYRGMVATSHYHLGVTHAALHQQERAVQAFHASIDVRKPLVEAHPDWPNEAVSLGECYEALAGLHRAAGRRDLAETSFRDALAVYQKLVDGHPSATSHHHKVISTALNLGDHYRLLGRLKEALRMHQDALTRSRRLLKLDPKGTESLRLSGASHYNVALTYDSLKRPELATKAYESALAIRRPLAEANPTEGWYQRDLTWSYSQLSRSCVRHGRQVEASHAARRSAAVANGGWVNQTLSAEWLYELACIQVSNAENVMRDPGRPLPERDKLVETWLRQAVVLLQRAANAGHFTTPTNRAKLHRDHDLARLRDRPDYAAFVRTLPAERGPR